MRGYIPVLFSNERPKNRPVHYTRFLDMLHYIFF